VVKAGNGRPSQSTPYAVLRNPVVNPLTCEVTGMIECEIAIGAAADLVIEEDAKIAL